MRLLRRPAIGIALLVIPALIVIGLLAYFSWLAAKQRREAMETMARSLGLNFFPDKDWSFDERYPFLGKLCQGDNRYAFNILDGDYHGYPVQAFDYHYETSSTDSKGNRTTTSHHFSFFVLRLGRQFPELVICREGWTSKIAQFLGYDDIDFESAEFSRRFLVRSPDKRFAYDVCNGQMIEHLLKHPDLNIEIDRDCLTLFFQNRLAPEKIRYNLDRLIELRDLFPAYLFENR